MLEHGCHELTEALCDPEVGVVALYFPDSFGLFARMSFDELFPKVLLEGRQGHFCLATGLNYLKSRRSWFIAPGSCCQLLEFHIYGYTAI